MSPTLDVNPQEMLRPAVAVESHLTLAPCGQILRALRHLVSRFDVHIPLQHALVRTSEPKGH
jgi:hypothetical protein